MGKAEGKQPKTKGRKSVSLFRQMPSNKQIKKILRAKREAQRSKTHGTNNSSFPGEISNGKHIKYFQGQLRKHKDPRPRKLIAPVPPEKFQTTNKISARATKEAQRPKTQGTNSFGLLREIPS